MEAQRQVVQTQRKTLDCLVVYESRLAELYAAFAERLPDRKAFWERMAAAALTQGNMIRSLDDVLGRGGTLSNIGRFEPEMMRMPRGDSTRSSPV